jgi:hypothetical protein
MMCFSVLFRLYNTEDVAWIKLTIVGTASNFKIHSLMIK